MKPTANWFGMTNLYKLFFKIWSFRVSWQHVKSPGVCVSMGARECTQKKRVWECMLELCALYKLGVYLAFDPRVQECDWSLLGYGVALQLFLVLTLPSLESILEHAGAAKMFHKILFLLCNKILVFYFLILYFILWNIPYCFIILFCN